MSNELTISYSEFETYDRDAIRNNVANKTMPIVDFIKLLSKDNAVGVCNHQMRLNKRANRNAYLELNTNTFLTIDCDTIESVSNVNKFLHEKDLFKYTITQRSKSFDVKGSVHYYILINLDSDYSAFIHEFKRLAESLGADRSVYDISRFIYNSPTAPKYNEDICPIPLSELYALIKDSIPEEVTVEHVVKEFVPKEYADIEYDELTKKDMDILISVFKRVSPYVKYRFNGEVDYLEISMSPKENSKGDLYIYGNNAYQMFLSSENSKRHLTQEILNLTKTSINGIPFISTMHLADMVKFIAEEYDAKLTESEFKAIRRDISKISSLAIKENGVIKNNIQVLEAVKRLIQTDRVVLHEELGRDHMKNNSKSNNEIWRLLEKYCGIVIQPGAGRRPSKIFSLMEDSLELLNDVISFVKDNGEKVLSKVRSFHQAYLGKYLDALLTLEGKVDLIEKEIKASLYPLVFNDQLRIQANRNMKPETFAPSINFAFMNRYVESLKFIRMEMFELKRDFISSVVDQPVRNIMTENDEDANEMYDFFDSDVKIKFMKSEVMHEFEDAFYRLFFRIDNLIEKLFEMVHFSANKMKIRSIDAIKMIKSEAIINRKRELLRGASEYPELILEAYEELMNDKWLYDLHFNSSGNRKLKVELTGKEIEPTDGDWDYVS